METSQPVQAKLTELNIPFEIVNHPPATTTAEADSSPQKRIVILRGFREFARNQCF